MNLLLVFVLLAPSRFELSGFVSALLLLQLFGAAETTGGKAGRDL